jgi:hypothetical protein
VDEAASRLRELRADAWQGLALGAAAVGGALGATEVAHDLVLPLFLAGMLVGARGMRALLERYALLETLLGDPDAYVIGEVREHALAETTLDRRRMFARSARTWLPPDERLGAVADELALLVAELEDETLDLDPACAVACKRLLCDPLTSPLLAPTGSAADVRSRLLRIHGGFAPRRVGDGSDVRADASAGPQWRRAASWFGRGKRRSGGQGVPRPGTPQ